MERNELNLSLKMSEALWVMDELLEKRPDMAIAVAASGALLRCGVTPYDDYVEHFIQAYIQLRNLNKDKNTSNRFWAWITKHEAQEGK